MSKLKKKIRNKRKMFQKWKRKYEVHKQMNTRGNTLDIENRKGEVFKNQKEMEKDKGFKR